MKKLLLYFLLTLPLVFVACGDDDEGDDVTIVAKWKCTSMEIDVDGKVPEDVAALKEELTLQMNEAFAGKIHNFRNDGIYVDPKGNENRYALQNYTLTIYDGDVLLWKFSVVSLTTMSVKLRIDWTEQKKIETAEEITKCVIDLNFSKQ